MTLDQINSFNIKEKSFQDFNMFCFFSFYLFSINTKLMLTKLF